MSFVEALLKHTRHYESPTSFWKWSAYACIAGVLRDNLFLVDGDSKLYPNVYILFLAGPSQKKGRPVNLAEFLVHQVNNVKTISGRSSIQAILIDVGQTETDASGRLKKGGSAIFFAPELAAGIVQDDQSIQILTDIYDYKPTGHTTNLIGRGKSRLEKLIFSMLVASNEELLKSVYTSKAIQGGLLGRTFLIRSSEFRPPNAFPKADEKGLQNLINLLRDISLLEGNSEFDGEAEEFYRLWYEEYYNALIKRKDVSGVHGRLPTGVKKLSVILAANDLSVIICQKHVEQAIHECISLLPNYGSFIISTGKSTIAEAGAIVLQVLASKNGYLVGRKELIRENWMHFDPDLLDKTMTAFETAGLIQTTTTTGEILYKLTDKGNEIMGIKKEEKKAEGAK